MGVLDDLRNALTGRNTQSFSGYKRPDQMMQSQIVPPDRNALANVNMGGPALVNPGEKDLAFVQGALPGGGGVPAVEFMGGQGGPGVVSDFDFSAPQQAPASTNEFMPKPGDNNLDRVRAGQAESDSKNLFDLIGRDSSADKYLALALGGFSMAEAAGKPGATFLSSLGAGGKAGVAGALSARAAARKSDTAKLLAEAKLAAARGKGALKTSPEAKLVRDLTGFAIGTSEHQAALKAHLEEKETTTDKLPTGDIQKAQFLTRSEKQMREIANTQAYKDPTHPNHQKALLAYNDLDTQRKYLERLPIMGNKGALASERIKEIQADPDFKNKKSPQYTGLQAEFKRQKLLFEASNADVPNQTRINQLENKIQNQNAQLLNKKQTPAREALIKQDIASIEKGVGALKVFAPINQQDSILLSGKVRTGAGQSALDTVASLMTTVGVEDPNKLLTMVGLPRSDVALGQVSTAQKNTVVGNILSGKAFGNNPSNADLKFIEAMVASLNLEPEANARINQLIFEQYDRTATKSIRAQKRLEERGGITTSSADRESTFMQKALDSSRLSRKKSFGVLSKEVSDWKLSNGGGSAANSPAYKVNITRQLNILKNSNTPEDVELLRRLKIHSALTTGDFNRVGVQ